MNTSINFLRHVTRMPVYWQIWIAVLVLVNLGALFFLDQVEAKVVLSALVIGGLVQMAIFSRKGFVRLLGAGHFHWIPMLVWIHSRMSMIQVDTHFYYWIWVLTVSISISLLIDIADVTRYVLGEREPAVSLEDRQKIFIPVIFILFSILLVFSVQHTIGGNKNTIPIFDTHVHYSRDAWGVYPPAEIIAKMQNAGVPRALVSSSPDEGTRMLYKQDPDRIVPFLRPYHADVNSGNWFGKSEVPGYLKQRLEKPIYRGIGEFHLHFDGNADAPVVRQTVEMAVSRGLFIHVHSNALAVRTIFDYAPRSKILWAHAGMVESPEVVSQMMDTYQNLWTDISIREYDIAPQGQLDPGWRALFLKHSDRITVGSDTWVTSRWGEYEQIIEFDRHWLSQLPREVAEKLAYGNAVRLFGAGPHRHLEP